MYTCNTFFFFSSRRRHTRSKRDWSSDVCSSDLLNILVTFKNYQLTHRGFINQDLASPLLKNRARFRHKICRSEERRVGKSVDLDRSGRLRRKEYRGKIRIWKKESRRKRQRSINH